MDELGFVFSPLDLKILILSILRRLPAEIRTEQLLNLCQQAGVVNYFDFNSCLDELASNSQIRDQDGLLTISERGARNAEALESSLPYSVRQRVEKAAAEEAARQARQKYIRTRHAEEDGLFRVELELSDGLSEVMSLRLLCADQQQAKDIESRFRLRAEDIYQQLMNLLSE